MRTVEALGPTGDALHAQAPLERKTSPVFFVDSVPPPGLNLALSKIRETNREILGRAENSGHDLSTMAFDERAELLGSIAQQELEKKWEAVTGVEPQNSRFILGSPIYNEARMGRSGLAMGSGFTEIPASVPVDHVFVTNRCSDGSEKMVEDYLAERGDVQKGLPTAELGDFSFDSGLHSEYSMVKVGNQKFIHLNTDTGSKANVWRILTEMAVAQNIPIAMSYDTNVSIQPDAPMKLYKEAHDSFVRRLDNAVILSAVTPEYVEPGQMDPSLVDTGLTPRQLLPFGLLVPPEHRVNGKFAAWDPKFYSEREGKGIPPTKIDDVVMAKQAEKHGASFRHVDDILSYEWGVPSVRGREAMLKRFTTGYLQMGNGLGLRDQSPELAFFEDANHREQVLFQNAQGNARLEAVLPRTVELWHRAVAEGTKDFMLDPHNPAFESIEGSK